MYSVVESKVQFKSETTAAVEGHPRRSKRSLQGSAQCDLD